MPLVFYTNKEFRVGKTFHTNDLCGENADVLEHARPAVREVENFLEAIRRDNSPEAPDRICSVLLQPWAALEEEDLRKKWRESRAGRAAKTRLRKEDPPPPPDGADYCYYVDARRGRDGAVLWMVDEAHIVELRARWLEIASTEEAYRLAQAYWSGVQKVFQGTYFLANGPITIDGVCLG